MHRITIDQFKRRGIYRIFAYLFGLTKFKTITFHEDHFTLDKRHSNVPVKYTDVLQKKHGGWPFKKLQINAFSNSYTFRGLSKKDLRRLLKQYEEAEAHAWRLRLKNFETELRLVSSWITDVEQRNYFQRSSVFASRMSTARKIERGIIGKIPNLVAREQLAKDLRKTRRFLENTHGARESCNAAYIPMEIARQQKLFDEIESHPLTDEQRKSVVVDEDANLVVAAAGSGKTSVIVAKAAWLLSKGLRKPDELLLLAFARDARLEMATRLKQRIPGLTDTEISVHTFHSLGLDILGRATGSRPSLSKLAEDKLALQNFINHAIRLNLNNNDYRNLLNKWFTEFFAPYESEFDFENYGQYWNYIKKHKIRSLKGELVKSFEECEIANFLYTNGIEYIYETDYEYKTSDKKRRQYQPDFYLPKFQIYIEHLGLRGFARTAPYVDRKEYLKSLRWKRDLHKQNGTTLVETYSCEKSQGVLTSRLKEKLEEKGVIFNPLDPDAMFDILRDMGRLDPFTALVTTFLGHFKGSNLTEDILHARNASMDEKTQARNAAFINVFMPVFNSYQEQLQIEDKIDFHDMISLACEQLETGKFQSPFRYIMVDEFQDISVGRSKLVSALQKYHADTQLFCVGDDWQAIFRFAGSDINVMKEFSSFFGNFERTDLSMTFRSEEKITKQATHFILQNEDQIVKKVSSFRKHHNPSVYVCFQKSNGEHYISDILQQIADETDRDNKAEVLILGRYNLKTYSKDYAKILSDLRGQFPDLEISFKTAHRSKGLEADYVIILEAIADNLGFPNERADDHVLDLVLAKAEDFPNSEERRLFYVSLTRAKKKVFICTESGKISPFVEELVQSPFQCEIWGKPSSALPKCHKCFEGKLTLKTGPHGNYWSCNNYPYCEHTEQPCPHCKQGYPGQNSVNELRCDVCEQLIVRCPRPDCGGHLQQEIGSYGSFWGCSKFRATGCDYKTKHLPNISQRVTTTADPKPLSPPKRIKQVPKKPDQRLTEKRSSHQSSEKLIPNKENIEQLRKTVTNAYKSWSDEEEDRLRQLVANGESVKSIAELMGRQVGAIRSRMGKLGL